MALFLGPSQIFYFLGLTSFSEFGTFFWAKPNLTFLGPNLLVQVRPRFQFWASRARTRHSELAQLDSNASCGNVVSDRSQLTSQASQDVFELNNSRLEFPLHLQVAYTDVS